MGSVEPGRVLVVGDMNVDLILTGDVVPRFGQAEQLLDEARLVVGGSASIVACGVAKLGVPTRLVSVVGDDVFGRMMLDQLRQAGVDVSTVRVDKAIPTGMSVILARPDDRTILTFPGTIPTLRPDDICRPNGAGDVLWAHVASPFLMPQFIGGLPGPLARLRENGVRVSLDPNWDPGETWQAIVPLLPQVDVLLPNRAEYDALRARADLSGVRCVVKDGSTGSFSSGPWGETTIPAPPADFVDAVGAGDSFDAGYLAACAYGVSDLAERMRWANMCGSRSTRAVGGTAAQPTYKELMTALKTIR